MNDITIEDEIKIIHDIQDDKEMFDAQMISNLKKTIADLEDDLTAAIDEVKDKDKRITELEELLDQIHLRATFELSEPAGSEVGALHDICNAVEDSRLEGGGDE